MNTSNDKSSLGLSIIIKGGMVCNVVTDNPLYEGLTVMVIDYDIEGADRDRLTLVKQGTDDRAQAYVHGLYIERSKIEID